jgi:5-methylcytosine-specific restriction endonuclease McrA
MVLMGASELGYLYRKNRAIVKREAASVCHLCGLPIDQSLPRYHPDSWTCDHVVPLALGGHPYDISNLAPAHWHCNSSKQDSLLRKSSSNTSNKW